MHTDEPTDQTHLILLNINVDDEYCSCLIMLIINGILIKVDKNQIIDYSVIHTIELSAR